MKKAKTVNKKLFLGQSFWLQKVDVKRSLCCLGDNDPLIFLWCARNGTMCERQILVCKYLQHIHFKSQMAQLIP